MFSSKIRISFLAVFIYLGIFLLFYFWSTPVDFLKELTLNNPFWGPLAYSFLAFLVVVIAPLTIAPLIPVASVVFGPFWAGLYTIIGWFLGSVVDFIIAREFGKPILKRFVSLESVERYQEYIHPRMEFWSVVLLRAIIPVDALSYALGLFSKISLWKYSLATFIGMAPMAFIISYAGEALFLNDFSSLITYCLLFVVLFSLLFYIYYKEGIIKEKYEENNNA